MLGCDARQQLEWLKLISSFISQNLKFSHVGLVVLKPLVMLLHRSACSPWMNFGRNGVWLYTNYVGTAGWSEFWAEDAASYRRQHPDFLESSCVIVSP